MYAQKGLGRKKQMEVHELKSKIHAGRGRMFLTSGCGGGQGWVPGMEEK